MCDVTGADYFWLTQNAGHIHETSSISPIHFSELLGLAGYGQLRQKQNQTGGPGVSNPYFGTHYLLGFLIFPSAISGIYLHYLIFKVFCLYKSLKQLELIDLAQKTISEMLAPGPKVREEGTMCLTVPKILRHNCFFGSRKL